VIIGSIMVFVIVGGLAVFFAPMWLLANWYPSGTDAETMNRSIGSAAQIVLFTLGGVIALVGVGVSLSRHGQELVAANRERELADLQLRAHHLDRDKEERRKHEQQLERAAGDERALRARFIAAVDLLADSESPIKRTAGIYAIAALADDWQQVRRPDERQVCIDVLCGYLRAPVGKEGTPTEEVEVRKTGYEVIRDHLRGGPGAAPRWAGAYFPLTGVTIDFPVDLNMIRVDAGTSIRLTGARVNGARLSFSGSTITNRGRLRLNSAHLRASQLDLKDLKVIDNGVVEVNDAVVTDTSAISAEGTRVAGNSRLDLNRVIVAEHSSVNLESAVVAARSRVQINGGEFHPGTRLNINGMTVEGESAAHFNVGLAERAELLKDHISTDEDSSLVVKRTGPESIGA